MTKEEALTTRTDMTEGTTGCGTPKLITLRKITDVMIESTPNIQTEFEASECS